MTQAGKKRIVAAERLEQCPPSSLGMGLSGNPEDPWKISRSAVKDLRTL
jgi:hypothetical protein